MAHIVDLLVNRFVEKLTEECKTKISSSDQTRANTIQSWRFQDNPVESPITLAVIGGNPGSLEYMDARLGYSDIENLDLRIPSGEIGGGHLWWRRGRVQISCNFLKLRLEKSQAATVAYRVLGRVTHWLERTTVSDLTDEFNEHAIMVHVPASTFYEGGGPEKQYFWRGEVLWQVLTQRPY